MWEVEDLSQESLYELSQSQSQGQDSSTDQVFIQSVKLFQSTYWYVLGFKSCRELWRRRFGGGNQDQKICCGQTCSSWTVPGLLWTTLWVHHRPGRCFYYHSGCCHYCENHLSSKPPSANLVVLYRSWWRTQETVCHQHFIGSLHFVLWP